MMRLTAFFLLALAALIPALSFADGPMGFTYNRSDISIVREKVPAGLPWLANQPVDPTLKFDIEVRDASTIYNHNLPNGQTGWYNLSSPADNSGVLMIFKSPATAPIMRTTEYAPLDILFIESDGRISQVIRSIKLSELDHDIVPDKPVLGFMFLKGGVTTSLSINPGDRVDNPLFQRSALVINKDATRVPKKAEDKAAATSITAPVPALVVPDVASVPKKKNVNVFPDHPPGQ